MIIDIPQNNPYKAVNDGDIRGSLGSTFCMDFEKYRGQALPGTRVINVATPTGTPVAFAGPIGSGSGSLFAISGSGTSATVYDSATDSPFSAWAQNSETGVPTDLDIQSADMIIFNDRLYVSGSEGGSLYRTTGPTTSWTEISSVTNGTDPNLLTTYAGRLYVTTEGDRIKSMTAAESVSATGSYTFDLGSVAAKSLVISCIRSVSDGIWFGTVNEDTGRAVMYKWDGVTANTADATYKIDAKGVLAMTIFNDRPYILTSKGSLQTFNGSFFEEVAQLPMEDERLLNLDADHNNRFVHPNGMAVIDEQIHVLVNTTPEDSSDPYPDKLHAGIYVFDEEVGLIHKHALCQTNDDESVTDRGMPEVAEVGGLYPALQGESANYNEYCKFLCGATYYTNATTTQGGIFAHVENDNNQDVPSTIKSGWFNTTKIQAQQIQEAWQRVVATYETMQNSTDKIDIYYKNNRFTPVREAITWDSDNSFEVTGDISSLGENNEVFIIRGVGAGEVLAIDYVDTVDGGYRVVLKDSVSGAEGTTGVVKLDSFKRVVNLNDTVGDFTKEGVGAESSWIQYKVYLQGTGDNPLFNRLISVSESKVNYQ